MKRIKDLLKPEAMHTRFKMKSFYYYDINAISKCLLQHSINASSSYRSCNQSRPMSVRESYLRSSYYEVVTIEIPLR